MKKQIRRSHLKIVNPPIQQSSPNQKAAHPLLSEFYIHAVLQAARGYHLGLDLESAKSWGLNRAIFYQATKNGYIRRYQRKETAPDKAHPSFSDSNNNHIPSSTPRNSETLHSVGQEKAYAVREIQGGIRFFIGGKEQKPQMFDRQISRRFPNFPLVWKEANDIMEKAGLSNLSSASHFHHQIYRRLRNLLAEHWSKGESALAAIQNVA